MQGYADTGRIDAFGGVIPYHMALGHMESCEGAKVHSSRFELGLALESHSRGLIESSTCVC